MSAPSAKYLEVTISNEQVAENIKFCIKTKRPFCLSRLGDGEIHLFNDTTPLKLKQIIANLWGFDISRFDDMRKQVCAQLATTLNESDIIGILNFDNDVCKKMKCKKEEWSLSIQKLKQMNIDIPICCDHQLPRSKLFGDPNNFKDIINGTAINIITPNINLDRVKLSNILQAPVSVTLVDNNRETLINKIQNIEESIVLYGVSITAKDLGVLLKNNGKIALDFGATLDAWAGIQTRPWFKSGNIQEYCVIK